MKQLKNISVKNLKDIITEKLQITRNKPNNNSLDFLKLNINDIDFEIFDDKNPEVVFGTIIYWVKHNFVPIGVFCSCQETNDTFVCLTDNVKNVDVPALKGKSLKVYTDIHGVVQGDIDILKHIFTELLWKIQHIQTSTMYVYLSNDYDEFIDDLGFNGQFASTTDAGNFLEIFNDLFGTEYTIDNLWSSEPA